MKKALLFLFILSFSYLSQADNWHPFPFKAVFYGKKAGMGAYLGLNGELTRPLVNYTVIDGLYMDSALQQSGLDKIRTRSLKYPKGINFNGGEFISNFFQTEIQTSQDSNQVVFKNQKPNSGPDDSLVFYPRLKKIGSSGPAQFSIETIFSIQDSVATIANGGKTYKWSKKFGIIAMPVSGLFGQEFNYELKGIHDLGLGWKPFLDKPAIPKAGDEYHFRKVERLEVGTTNPPCIPQNVSKTQDLRIKVLAYPYQNDSSKAQYEYIVSEADANTGIVYGGIEPISNLDFNLPIDILKSPFQFPGTFIISDPFTSNGWNFGYLIDSLGITLSYVVSPFVWDAGPTYNFLSCSPNPFFKLDQKYVQGGPFACHSTFMNFSYPFYIKSQNGCTMGTPLPEVTITSVPNIFSKGLIQLAPNPAKSKVNIRIPDYLESELAYDLINLKGQSKKGIISLQDGEGQIDVENLAAGLYSLRVSAGKLVWMEKIVLDK